MIVLFSLSCVVAKPLKEYEDCYIYLYFKVIFLLRRQIKGIILLRIKKKKKGLRNLSPVCEKVQSVFLGSLGLAGFGLHLGTALMFRSASAPLLSSPCWLFATLT